MTGVLLAALCVAAAPPAFVAEPLVPGAPFVLRGHTDGVQVIGFSPDGGALASLGRDRQLRVWNPRTGERLSSLELPAQPSALSFSPDGARLAVGSVELQVLLVELAKPAISQTIAHPDVVSEVAFSPDGGSLAVAGAADTGIVYPLAALDKKVAFRGRSATWAADGRSLLIANGAGLVATIDAATGKVRQTLASKEEKARALQTADGRLRLSWSPLSGELKVWSGASKRPTSLTLPAGPPVGDRPAPVARLTAAALSTDGQRLLTASTDGALRLWSLGTRTVLGTWPVASAPSVALSPDGAWVAAADGALVKLWKAP